MPKAKRPPARETRRASVASASTVYETQDPVDAILYQPARVTASARVTAPRPMMRGKTAQEPDSEQKRISVLSQSLPEATSYSGRNYVTLQGVKGGVFKQRSGDGSLIVFDGNCYVDLGNPPHLQGNSVSGFTVEAWVKTMDTKGYRFMVAHGTPGKEVFLRIFDGTYEFAAWDGKQHHGIAGEQGNAALRRVRSEDIGMWVHLAGVYDRKAGKWSLYRNGELVESVKSTTGPLDVDQTWTIGACWSKELPERFFKGSIAEVRIWTVARTEDEIGSNMYTIAPDATQGTLGGFWRLNEEDGTVAIDSAPRKCHGAVLRPGGAGGEQARKARLAEAENRANTARAEANKAKDDLEHASKMTFPKLPGNLFHPMKALGRVEQRAAALERAAGHAEATLQRIRIQDKAGEPARAIGAWPINDLSALTRKQGDARVEAGFASNMLSPQDLVGLAGVHST